MNRHNFKPLSLLGLALAAALVAPSALAAPAGKKSGGGGGGARSVAALSSVEFGMKGLFDLDTNDSTAAYVDLTLGYFVLQGVEIGLTTMQGTTPNGQRDTSGLFGEYDFVNSTQYMPFFGMAIKHAAPPTGVEQRDAILGSVYFGNNLVIAPNVALSLTAQLAWSDQKALGAASQRKKSGRDINLGLRLFF